jgi:hypothetical protein
MYGMLSLGLSVHLHYCCGKLKSFSINEEAVACCEPGKTEGCTLNTSCCSSEEFRIAIEDEHQPTINGLDLKKLTPGDIFYQSSEAHNQKELCSLNPPVRGSPSFTEVSSYIKYCRLTYYG